MSPASPAMPWSAWTFPLVSLVFYGLASAFGAPLERICQAVLQVLAQHPTLGVIAPLHPNPDARGTLQETAMAVAPPPCAAATRPRRGIGRSRSPTRPRRFKGASPVEVTAPNSVVPLVGDAVRSVDTAAARIDVDMGFLE